MSGLSQPRGGQPIQCAEVETLARTILKRHQVYWFRVREALDFGDIPLYCKALTVEFEEQSLAVY